MIITNLRVENTAPAETAAAVTPSDSVDFAAGICRAIFVGVQGDVSAVIGGVSLVFKNAIGIVPIRVSRINSTGTTATDIVALY